MELLVETQFDKPKAETDEKDEEEEAEEKVKVKTLRIADNRLFNSNRTKIELQDQLHT
jgi:hypothetical protein